MKKKKNELEIVEPVYATYHYQGVGSAVIAENPSIRNWYLNEIMILGCTRRFLRGFTSPEIHVYKSSWIDNPYLERKWCPMQFVEGYIHPIIRNFIDRGYYVCYGGIDDYYIRGKTFYHTRHFEHDGAICGYDQEAKTYCIYSYDDQWVYRKFWTPQRGVEAGRRAMFKKGVYGSIYGIRPKKETVEFSSRKALETIREYLDSTKEQYPESEEGTVHGIVVQEYIAEYVRRLFSGEIPYERMDQRVFRLIWEHKRLMHERIRSIEKQLDLGADISQAYASLVRDADGMRMLYAAHRMKRHDSVLPVIRKKLLTMNEREHYLLTDLLQKGKGEF